MNDRRRFNILVLLGLAFLALALHNVASSRLGIIIERDSVANVVGLFPGGPVGIVVAVAVFATALFLVFIFFSRWLEKRKGPSRRLVIGVVGISFLVAGCLVALKNPRYPLPQEWSGATAVVVGISILMFMTLRTRRSLAVAHLALLAAVFVAGAVPHCLPRHRAKIKTLRGYMETAMNDLDRRHLSWGMASPLEVLTDARNRAEKHLVYRFEEHLQNVTALEAPEIDATEGVLFDIPRDGKFVAVGPVPAESEIVQGKQVFADYAGGTLLRTETPLEIERDDVGAFQITMTVSDGEYFQVFWGKDPDTDRRTIRIPLGQPGKSTSYEIKDRMIRSRAPGVFGHAWIVPSEENARVEIESFRIVDRVGAVLHGASFSVGYEDVDDEIRKVLFVNTPFQIEYRVVVPSENPRITFGLATLDESIPTTFEVIVGSGGQNRTIFSRKIAGESPWQDLVLDLGEWAGRTVDIRFRTNAPSSTVGCWSNPVMMGDPAPQPNVVIYLVDCLRAQSLGAYGYDRNTSPVFDALSLSGTLFERAFANGPNTKLSVPSLFTSNPISATGVRSNPDVLPEEFPTLAEILRTMGYATAALTTNGNVGPYSGTHQGFSRLFTPTRFKREAGTDQGPPDAEHLIGDLLQGWIQQNKDRNFFLYVHTMDAHGVYDPPEPYRHFYESLESGTPVARNGFDPDWISSPTREGRTALYDGEIAYGDHHFGRFVDMLAAAGVLDNTIVIFMADHGEYLGEHRLWGHHPPPFAQGTHIPLLVVGPGFPAGARVGELVQIMDVLPTVLDAVGMAPDPVLFQGQSLLPLARGEQRETMGNRTVFIEAGQTRELGFNCGDFLVLPEKNFIFDVTGDPAQHWHFNEFVLDFRTKAMGRKLAEKYVATYSALHEIVSPVGGDALEVDPETLEQLRSLGYIQ